MELFKLFGSILIDTDEANKSMSKTEKTTDSFSNKLGNVIGTAGKFGLALGTACAAGAAALYGIANKAVETTDEIDKMSAKIGLSKEGYQEWSYVLGQNGMDISKLQTGMKTLVQQMDSASSGTASAVENFEKLGVSIYDSSGKMKNQETMMKESLYALSDMENGTEKARLATELFGKAGTEMMPMLNNGSASMEELTQKAHDLGLIIDDETVSAGVLLGDTMDDVKQSLTKMVVKIGAQVMPVIQDLCDVFIENMPLIQKVFGAVFNFIQNTLATIIPIIVNFVTSIIDFINGLNINWSSVWNTICAVVENAFNFIVELWNNILSPLITLIINVITNVFVPLFGTAFDLIMPIVENVFNYISTLWNTVLQPLLNGIILFLDGIFTMDMTKIWNGICGIFEAAWNYISLLFSTVGNFFGGVVNAIKSPFITLGQWFSGIFQGIAGFITGAFKSGGQIFGGIVNGFTNVFKPIINSMLRGIENVINTPLGWLNNILNSIRSFDIPLVGKAFKGLWKKNPIGKVDIPMLSTGAEDVEGDAIVGEAGPELLSSVGNKTSVIPLTKSGGSNQHDLIDYEKMTRAFIKAIQYLKLFIGSDEIGSIIDERLLEVI